jgi:SAM-dependent methyltransferase
VTTLAEPLADVFSAALRGERCHVVGAGGAVPLPVSTWVRSADHADRAVLAQCVGPTLDVGCGPGRMTEHLTRGGHAALGIDVVPEAVRQARARGVAALLRNVYDDVPGEGRWATVLLADGNVGIGGDPRRLLARSAALLEPGGRVVVDLAPPGSGVRTLRLRLRVAAAQSAPFAWSTVAADRVGVVCAGLGLAVLRVEQHDGRWFAVLAKDSR